MWKKIETLSKQLEQTPIQNKALLVYSLIMLIPEIALASQGDYTGAGLVAGLISWPVCFGADWKWNKPGKEGSILGYIVGAFTSK